MSSIVIRKENITRLIRDVKDVLKNPLHDNGIHYKHDDTDMLKGYALVIGPSETPYQDGFFLFEIRYPPEYPYLPPTVTYCTNGQNIRFNPNLYRKGKVCLSILNTWQGEQWTSCETIRSVLLHLCGLLNPLPLLNEPGIVPGDPEIAVYNEIIEYATYSLAIGDILCKKPGVYQPFFDLFYEEMEAHFRQHRGDILARIAAKRDTYVAEERPLTLYVDVFTMCVYIDYPAVLTKIERI
jgi:ubiquitin-protein ligase